MLLAGLEKTAEVSDAESVTIRFYRISCKPVASYLAIEVTKFHFLLRKTILALSFKTVFWYVRTAQYDHRRSQGGGAKGPWPPQILKLTCGLQNF